MLGILSNGLGQKTSDSSSSDSVSITSIVHESDNNIFSSETLTGSGGKVEGTVKNGTSGQDEIYTINFSVTHSGKTTAYSLDPKIQVSTGGGS